MSSDQCGVMVLHWVVILLFVAFLFVYWPVSLMYEALTHVKRSMERWLDALADGLDL